MDPIVVTLRTGKEKNLVLPPLEADIQILARQQNDKEKAITAASFL